MFKRNPAHKKRANESIWHKLTFVVVGYVIARHIPAADIVSYVKDAFDIAPDLVGYVIDNAVGIVALVSVYLKFKEKKGQK